MKKKTLITISLLVITAMLYASPIAFGLDSSFSIDDLIIEGFSLKTVNDTIIVTPPESRISSEENGIEQFMLMCLEGFDDWQLAILQFNNNYNEAYNFISKNYGEGLTKDSTEFFAQHYSSDFSDDVIMTKFLSGALSEYLKKAVAAEILNGILEDENVSNINMWIANELYIFTATPSNMEEPVAIFFKTDFIEDYVDSMTKLTLSLIASDK